MGPSPMQPQVEGRLAEVMLVEDDASMRDALVRILRGAGFRVRAFASAETLFADLEHGPFPETVRCCICDVHLPGACGFELQRRLAATGATPRWIFISAHDEPALRGRRSARGPVTCPSPSAVAHWCRWCHMRSRPLELSPACAPKGKDQWAKGNSPIPPRSPRILARGRRPRPWT